MKKIRILLAEDHILVREGFRELIQCQSDMEIVGEAANGEEAIQLVAQCRPDVVLMDIAMPYINGIEATKQIKESYPHVAILVLTAYDSDEFIFAIAEARAAGYLLKNVQREELYSSIRAVYHGESVLHPVVVEKLLRHFLFTDEKKAKPMGEEILSPRELEVLNLGAKALTNKQISKNILVGVRTVQTHWRNIFNKLGVSSRTEAIMYGLQNGWIILGKATSNDR